MPPVAPGEVPLAIWWRYCQRKSPVAASIAWTTPPGMLRNMIPSWTIGPTQSSTFGDVPFSMPHDHTSSRSLTLLRLICLERAEALPVIGAPEHEPVARIRVAQHGVGNRPDRDGLVDWSSNGRDVVLFRLGASGTASSRPALSSAGLLGNRHALTRESQD